jgi:hypothetical protein
MALNGKKVVSNNNNRVQQEPLDPGSYPARVVQIIDLGIQPQRPFKGEEKPPCHEIMFTYECLDEFCVDEDGNELEDKPRWLSETFPFRSLMAEMAKSTKRYKALDPDDDHDGDFTALIETPCLITVVNNEYKEKVYNNIGNVSAMRAKDAQKAPELKNEAKVFVLDEPDMEIFLSLPTWLQDKIKANLEFEGSALQEALQAHQKGDKAKGKADPKGKAKPVVEEQDDASDEDAGDDNIPW